MASNTGGSSSDCEGEDPEDPSFSHIEETVGANAALDIQEQAAGGDELSTFRQQWQRELDATSPQDGARNHLAKPLDDVPQTDYERARQCFQRASELELQGRWFESIREYKRAMVIHPNIELMLYQEGIMDNVEEEIVEVEAPPERSLNVGEDEEEEEMVPGEDLLTRIQRIQGRKDTICEPNFNQQGTHISWLPSEVIVMITRWVVSADLDATSLERLGATCRGFYLVARDQDIWRNICIRTWGIDCSTPRAHGYQSWRRMYLERARLQLHGCYISCTNYLRHGESSFQDQNYRPWFLVQYYRYLRFFSEGMVVMMTTPEEPHSAVAQLRSRAVKPAQGVLLGHYRLRGDKVIITMKKHAADKKSSQTASTRFRSRRKEPEQQEKEQTFHIVLQSTLQSWRRLMFNSGRLRAVKMMMNIQELQLLSTPNRRNMRLAWLSYSVCTRRDQWSQFELTPAKFPPLCFSRVRHYTREGTAPLPSGPYSM